MKSMTLAVLAGLTLAVTIPVAQEKPVPKDSARISIAGCARGRVFIVGRSPSHEPVRSDIAPGRRFRLNAKKDMREAIKKQEAYMIEVTGLIRQQDLAPPPGINIGGVRIGGGPPQAGVADARRNMGGMDPVIDVESWRPLPEPCPSKARD
jgi:hypothetical protein